jgi:hypothetical protein
MPAMGANSVLFKLQTSEEQQRQELPRRNLNPNEWREVFNSHPTSLPEKTTHDRRGEGDEINDKSKLRNKCIDYLEDLQLGWDASVAQSTGKTFVHELHSVLWAISPWHSKFIERGTQERTFILTEWDLLKDSKNANNLSAKKRGENSRQITQEELKVHEEMVWTMCERPYMRRARWDKLRENLVALVRCMEQQRVFLAKQLERQRRVHADAEHSQHAHVPNLDDYIIFREPASEVLEQYRAIDIKMQEADFYTAIMLNDAFLPTVRRQRYWWLHDFAVSMPTVTFCYHQGGSKPSLTWCFKLDPEDNETVQRESMLRMADDLRNLSPTSAREQSATLTETSLATSQL